MKVNVVTRPCMMCGKTSEMVLDFDKVTRWQRGEFVRVVRAQTENDGKMKWKLPKTLEPGDGYQFYIQSVDVPAVDDIGNNSFTLVEATEE